MGRIRLSNGRYVFVDDKLRKQLKAVGAWHLSAQGYAIHTTTRNGKCYAVYMHRLVLKLAGVHCGERTDHRDGNRLNNRRRNLRPTDHKGNARNSTRHVNNLSGFKGVSFYKRDNNWEARIYANGVHHRLGRFDTARKAARAYNNAARKLHGRFAKLNPI